MKFHVSGTQGLCRIGWVMRQERWTMGSDHGGSWVLSYRTDLEGGGEPLKDLSRRGTCHNQRGICQKDLFGNCEADGLQGRGRDLEASRAKKLYMYMSGHLTCPNQGRGLWAPLVLDVSHGACAVWWDTSLATGHVTGNCLSVHRPTAGALEVNPEVERERSSVHGGARPCASVHSAFRERISPWGMGMAAEARGR